jgi:hypothetical protein
MPVRFHPRVTCHPRSLLNLSQVMPSITSGNWHRLSRGKFVVVAVSHPSDADAERVLQVKSPACKNKTQDVRATFVNSICSGCETSRWSSSAKNFTHPRLRCFNLLYLMVTNGLPSLPASQSPTGLTVSSFSLQTRRTQAAYLFPLQMPVMPTQSPSS